jgi:pyrroline-5-carboxylate reductase
MTVAPASAKPLHITLIGCGKMGSAMMHGWLSQDLIETAVIIDPHGIEDALLHNSRVSHFHAMPDRPITSDVLVLAVKPQILQDACAAITAHITPQTLILSIAAGQSLSSLGSIFGAQHPIIRSMPNTPAAIGKGITAAIKNSHVTEDQCAHAQSLLHAIGRIEWIMDETLMDAITALSGSGPAYIFYMIEALAKAGETLGLSAQSAMTLARQTVIGSAALAESTPNITSENLRKNVTSPNGTTQAALDVLMDGRYQDILSQALIAARDRSIDLNKS